MRPTIRRKKPGDADEASWSTVVEDFATLHGWLSFHVPDSRRMHAGLPDYLFLRPGRCVFAELKAPGGRVRPDQARVLELLRTVPGIEVYLWAFPDSWVEARDALL